MGANSPPPTHSSAAATAMHAALDDLLASINDPHGKHGTEESLQAAPRPLSTRRATRVAGARPLSPERARAPPRRRNTLNRSASARGGGAVAAVGHARSPGSRGVLLWGPPSPSPSASAPDALVGTAPQSAQPPHVAAGPSSLLSPRGAGWLALIGESEGTPASRRRPRPDGTPQSVGVLWSQPPPSPLVDNVRAEGEEEEEEEDAASAFDSADAACPEGEAEAGGVGIVAEGVVGWGGGKKRARGQVKEGSGEGEEEEEATGKEGGGGGAGREEKARGKKEAGAETGKGGWEGAERGGAGKEGRWDGVEREEEEEVDGRPGGRENSAPTEPVAPPSPALREPDLRIEVDFSSPGVLAERADDPPSVTPGVRRAAHRITIDLLCEAAACGDRDTLRSIVEAGACSIGALSLRVRTRAAARKRSSPPPSQKGRNALHEACANGNAKLARILMRHGAQPAAKTMMGGLTALHVAAASGHVDCVISVLDAGGNVDWQDKVCGSQLPSALRGHPHPHPHHRSAAAAPCTTRQRKGWQRLSSTAARTPSPATGRAKLRTLRMWQRVAAVSRGTFGCERWRTTRRPR